MSTYEDKITAYIGEAAGGDIAYTQTQVSDWLTEGARDILNQVSNKYLRVISTKSSAIENSSGSAIKNAKVLSVDRNNGSRKYPCRRILPEYSDRAGNVNDMLYAMPTDPCFYIQDGKLYILPNPTSVYKGYYHYVAYPVIVYGDSPGSYNSSDLFPEEFEPLLTKYAVIQIKQREATLLRRNAEDELGKLAFVETKELQEQYDKILSKYMK